MPFPVPTLFYKVTFEDFEHLKSALDREHKRLFPLISFSGIQDENGKYLIPVPTWSSKVLYNAGTRIYYNNDYDSPDRLEIDGPTNMTLKIVVGRTLLSHMCSGNVTMSLLSLSGFPCSFYRGLFIVDSLH